MWIICKEKNTGKKNAIENSGKFNSYLYKYCNIISCPGCSDVVRRSDKHVCVELLKIQIQEKKAALEEQIKEYEKLVQEEKDNPGFINFLNLLPRLHFN